MGAPLNRKPRILVIEDNPGDVELLELALQHAQLDCDLTVFQHGGEALAFINANADNEPANAPDLAILDVNLPQNDGIEILEAMRNSSAFAKVPVALFSSSWLPRQRERLDALQVRRYINKPADLDEMLGVGTVIKELLEG